MKFASARTLVALFAYLESIGVSPREVADASEIAFAKGAAASDRIPIGLATNILERCAERLADPLFGLKYAQGVDPKLLGPITLFWRYAPTLRYSNDFSARILHMHYEGFAAVLDVDGGEARFIQHMDGELRRGGRQSVEMNLSFSLRVCRWILGSDWSPLRLTFIHEASCERADYAEVLKAPVVFGAAEDALVVKTSDLDRQSEGHDPEILDFIEHSLIALAGQQPLGFDDRLARTIDTLLAMKSAKVRPTASALGMSVRSLQRRLAENGTSFQAVLAERRQAIIEAASEDSRRQPLAVLAERTGYSDPSAVSRFIRQRKLSTRQRLRGTSRENPHFAGSFTMPSRGVRRMSQSVLTPAIRRRASPRPSLLVFEISAKIAKPDIEAMAKVVEAAFDAYDKIDMLLIMTDFEGMDADAAFDREALGAQARSIRHVRKYGVVGAPAWARAMIEVSDFLSPVDAKTFDLAEEAQAWAWIEESPTV